MPSSFLDLVILGTACAAPDRLGIGQLTYSPGQKASISDMIEDLMVEGFVASGRAALEAGRWDKARDMFKAALAEGPTPEALDGMGEAQWWLGEPRASVEYRQRAYRGYRQAGDNISAALTAIGLCVTYLSNFGNSAAATGWLGRAERVLSDDPGPLQGWLWLMHGYMTDDLDRARELLERALAFARENEDRDLELVGLADLGLKLVIAGSAREGLALIDEAMAGTLGGEHSRFETVVYTSCDMLAACDLAGDLERATQWCRVADDFIRDYGCPFLYSHCRTLYGSVLLAKGRWSEAESELAVALHMADGAGPALHARALTRLADLRCLQGRLEEAETLLSGLDYDIITGLAAARLKVAQGKPELATALLQRYLRQIGDRHIEVPPALAILVDALIAAGHLGLAQQAALRLDATAQAQSRTYATSLAALAHAHLSVATGETTDQTVAHLDDALEGFSRLELPLEMAIAKLDLAKVVAQSQPELAVAEGSDALRLFEEIGATTYADGAASFLRSLGATGRTWPRKAGVLTRREQEVLRYVGLGLSNPEIAERLFISRRTAGHHVSSLLTKLGLRNRAEAVAYAARTLGQPETRQS